MAFNLLVREGVVVAVVGVEDIDSLTLAECHDCARSGRDGVFPSWPGLVWYDNFVAQDVPRGALGICFDELIVTDVEALARRRRLQVQMQQLASNALAPSLEIY